MRKLSVYTTIVIGLLMSTDVHGMNAVLSFGRSLLTSNFVKNHTREFVVIIGAAIAVGGYKSFFARLDRIESLVQEIEGKINTASVSVAQLDGTVKASIQKLLDKIDELPRNKDMENLLLELRKILIEDLIESHNQSTQKLFDFETRVYEQLGRLEKSIEAKLARLEQKIDRYYETVKGYQTDVDTGLNTIVQGQKQILHNLPAQNLKQALKPTV